MKTETKPYDRIEALARRHGVERSLYLGEAIGNVLAIAWDALGSLRVPKAPKAAAKPQVA